MIALDLAALLLLCAGIAHSYLGERYVLMRLFRRPDLPKLFGGTEFTVRTLRLAWHVTSIAWWGFAAILTVMAHGQPTRQNIAWVAGDTFLLTGVGILLWSHGRHWAWLLFFVVGAICDCAALGWL